jgi:hypothetical protein
VWNTRGRRECKKAKGCEARRGRRECTHNEGARFGGTRECTHNEGARFGGKGECTPKMEQVRHSRVHTQAKVWWNRRECAHNKAKIWDARAPTRSRGKEKDRTHINRVNAGTTILGTQEQVVLCDANQLQLPPGLPEGIEPSLLGSRSTRRGYTSW